MRPHQCAPIAPPRAENRRKSLIPANFSHLFPQSPGSSRLFRLMRPVTIVCIRSGGRSWASKRLQRGRRRPSELQFWSRYNTDASHQIRFHASASSAARVALHFHAAARALGHSSVPHSRTAADDAGQVVTSRLLSKVLQPVRGLTFLLCTARKAQAALVPKRPLKNFPWVV